MGGKPRKRGKQGAQVQEPFSWQQPPDGLFDVIVPMLTAKQFVLVQLVCKDWCCAARSCLKDAVPKRPDVNLQRLANLYPNLTHLDLSHVEGLSALRLTPLQHLTALRSLCLSNISTQDHQEAGHHCGTGDPDRIQQALSPAPGRGARAQTRSASAAQRQAQAANVSSSEDGGNEPQGSCATDQAIGQAEPTTAPAPQQQQLQKLAICRSPAIVRAGETPPRKVVDTAGPSAPQRRAALPQPAASGAAGAIAAAPAAPTATGGAAGPAGAAGAGGSSLAAILSRLTKLQADLCPALTADSIAALHNLSELTVDSLVAPEQLAPLTRLQALSIKRMANCEQLDTLRSLTSLLINSDSSCAADFVPVCARLPHLASLTFKCSSVRLPRGPAEYIDWQAFSRLTLLDLRSPVEVLRPGLPAIAELGALSSLVLDFYCASEEELMLSVVAPPNLQHLFVTSDRNRSGGVVDIQPSPCLTSARIRLYWTALNLVTEPGATYPALTSLALDACFFLLYGQLVPSLRQFPGLRTLTLDNCLALEDCEVAALTELPGLTELSLSGCHLVSDAGLRALAGLPALRTLRVKGLRKLSVHAAQAYVRQRPITRRYEDISATFLSALTGLPSLRCLVLKHLHTAGETHLLNGLAALTGLTKLEIKDVHSMSDAVLLGLTRHTGLRELSVLHCEGVSHRGRGAIVRSLGPCVALEFEGCNIVDITRPCALPTLSTQAQLLGDDRASSSTRPRRSTQHSNQQ